MIKKRYRTLARKYGYHQPTLRQSDDNHHPIGIFLEYNMDVLGEAQTVALKGQATISQQELLKLTASSNSKIFDQIINDTFEQTLRVQESQLDELVEMVEKTYTCFLKTGEKEKSDLRRFVSQILRTTKRDGRYKILRQKLSRRLHGYAADLKYRQEIEVFRNKAHEYGDYPKSWPQARNLKRKLIFFAGPTNSGKTWAALNELTMGESGAYLAPLRLLALEGQEEIENRGKKCSFLTGEERDLKEGATFISSTIELVNLTQPVDTVLIDEIQLIGDAERGAAWTAALVGAPAKKILMTGAPEAIEAVQKLADKLGEELEVRTFERLAPLEVLDRNTTLRELKNGSAVIAFSRKDVLNLKERIEANSERKVSVIYGNLSPQVRREEARRFRSGETQILVSTDAIAMGLNLPIEHIVFFQVEKFDGESVRHLTPSEVKQISGRAGRFGLKKSGTVSTVFPDHMDHIHYCINNKKADKTIPPIFRVMPDHRHVSLISDVIGADSLEKILVFFRKTMEFDHDIFVPTDLDDVIILAGFADQFLQGSLEEKLTFSLAPVNPDDDQVMEVWHEMIHGWNVQDESNLDFLFEEGVYTEGEAKNSRQLLRAEGQIKALTLYAWLAYRYHKVFNRIADCEKQRDLVSKYVERSLRSSIARQCTRCGTLLNSDSKFAICRDCFQRRRNNPRGHKGYRRARSRTQSPKRDFLGNRFQH